MRVQGYRGRLTTEHFLLMEMPQRFWNVKFEEIAPGLREVIREYLRNMHEMLDRGDGLLLWGENGRGKTSACCFVAKEVRRTGASVLVMTAARLIDSEMESVKGVGSSFMDRARTVDFLVLDDLGKEHQGKGEWSERLLESLLRERSGARLATFITANMGPEHLRQRYKPSLVEMLKEITYPVCVEGENKRDRAMIGIAQRVGLAS